VSFLEDRQATSSRNSPSSRPRRRQGPGRDVRLRQLVALGIGLVVLLLLLFGVRSCRDSRAERGRLDYVQEASAVVDESRQTSDGLFGLLRDPGDQSPVELQSTVNGFRVQAEQLAERAARTDRPDELSQADRFLVETLELRRDGMAGVARELPTALADEGREAAARRIAEEMRVFLASDVVYARRFRPTLEERLRGEEFEGQTPRVPESVFLGDIAWLRPETVASRIGRIRSPEGDRAASPGSHGTGLSGVSATPSGTALSPDAPVEIPSGPRVGIDVKVQNQGENEEDVRVRLVLKPEGEGEPVEVERKLDDKIAPGETETVSIPLVPPPPLDEPVSVEVEVVPVPGEEMRENNKAAYSVTFTRKSP
jgi:hypothetical protein